jgi:hypothetical protein
MVDGTESRQLFTESRQLFTESRQLFTESRQLFTESCQLFTESSGVEMVDGTKLTANVVLSGTTPYHTFMELLPGFDHGGVISPHLSVISPPLSMI